MAGMLPGVECARRRRLHQSGGWSDSAATAGHGSTRRSSFCLYASNHESLLTSSSSLKRGNLNQGHKDEKLGGLAGEAKDRLDERLRAQRKSETKRNNNSQESLGFMKGRTITSPRDLKIEVFGLNRSGSKRFSWAKLGWKAQDQDECAICLDQFKTREQLVNLPCAHRFHSRCLGPWLANNAHCPCCRRGILN